MYPFKVGAVWRIAQPREDVGPDYFEEVSIDGRPLSFRHEKNARAWITRYQALWETDAPDFDEPIFKTPIDSAAGGE